MGNPVELVDSTLSLLETDAPLVSYLKMLRRFKDEGGTVDAARAALQEVRARVVETEREDRVLEVLDLIEGFAGPGWKVW